MKKILFLLCIAAIGVGLQKPAEAIVVVSTPPPPPVVPRGNQTPQISQAPKNPSSDKGIVPPQVFLHGKGGR